MSQSLPPYILYVDKGCPNMEAFVKQTTLGPLIQIIRVEDLVARGIACPSWLSKEKPILVDTVKREGRSADDAQQFLYDRKKQKNAWD